MLTNPVNRTNVKVDHDTRSFQTIVQQSQTYVLGVHVGSYTHSHNRYEKKGWKVVYRKLRTCEFKVYIYTAFQNILVQAFIEVLNRFVIRATKQPARYGR